MSKRLMIVGAIVATAVATAANADTIAYNTSLAAGYYNGTGNPNVGFTTDTASNGVQLGLGVNERFIGPVVPTSTNNYTVPIGTSGSPPPGTATWDFEYSVDFGNSGLTIPDTTALLTILNVGTGQSVSFNPAAISDNATNGDGYQNAENLAFSFIAPFISFDPNTPDQYLITLSLASKDAPFSASVSEDINATPLPAALPLFATGFGVLAFFGWRRKRSAQILAA